MSGEGKALGHLKSARPVTARPDARPPKHMVTLIPGDSVGDEVADAVVKVVGAAGVSLGWDRQISGPRAQALHGGPLPTALIDSILKNKVALKGRIGTPIGGGAAFTSPNVTLRKVLDLYASVRPARNLPGLKSRYEGVDLVVIRENTEDLYVGIENEVVPGVVQSLKVVTEAASSRIARFAFDYAVRHGRKSVTCVHKANILKMSDGLFLECVRSVSREFPGIECREIIADNCLMQLVRNPWQFDVLVMGNMLGDIVSDLCAGLVGGLGAVPGINIGDKAVVFEAIHGNAPHLEGQDLANPLTLLVPAISMLRHLGEEDAAGRILKGVSAVLAEARVLTPDLGGAAHTSAMTQAIIERMTV